MTLTNVRRSMFFWWLCWIDVSLISLVSRHLIGVDAAGITNGWSESGIVGSEFREEAEAGREQVWKDRRRREIAILQRLLDHRKKDRNPNIKIIYPEQVENITLTSYCVTNRGDLASAGIIGMHQGGNNGVNYQSDGPLDYDEWNSGAGKCGSNNPSSEIIPFDKYGPQPKCWADHRFNFQKCCNGMSKYVERNYCWSEEFTAEFCCGKEIWFPRTCLELVRRFEFQQLQNAFAHYDPLNVAYSQCLSLLREGTGHVIPGQEIFSVAGLHYPTITIHHAGQGKKFSMPAFDGYVGNNFLEYGEWMPSEVQIIQMFLPKGSVVIDAGANIGGFTIPLARRIGRDGMIHAFEPFRVLFQHLTANVAMNGLLNVQTHQVGLGAKSEDIVRPMPDMNKMSNPSKSHVTDDISSSMGVETEQGYMEVIKIRTLDEYFKDFKERVYMIKIDVESMELPMLKGAHLLLLYHRPWLFVEDSEWDAKDATQPLDIKSRPHLHAFIEEKRQLNGEVFLPDIEVSTQVTRFLFYYGYVCIELRTFLRGMVTSSMCVPDEKYAAMYEGLRGYKSQEAKLK